MLGFFLQILFPVVFGTYGSNIYTADFDSESHTFSNVSAIPAVDASFVIKTGEGYCAVSENQKAPGAYTFSDSLQELSYLNEGVGESPCNILQYGHTILTANYGSGTISVIDVDDDYRITRVAATLEFEGNGPAGRQQAHPRIHQVVEFGQDWLLANDLGADCIRILKKNPETGIPEHRGDFKLPAGCGPRIMTFNEDGTIIYLVTEISREIYVIHTGNDGDIPSFEIIQRLRCDDSEVSGGADIAIHPSGKWLYASMRNDHDGIARYTICEDGTLKYEDYTLCGRHPRSFAITPDGGSLIAACVFDECVEVFAVSTDGSLVPSNQRLKLGQDRPTSVKILSE